MEGPWRQKQLACDGRSPFDCKCNDCICNDQCEQGWKRAHYSPPLSLRRAHPTAAAAWCRPIRPAIHRFAGLLLLHRCLAIGWMRPGHPMAIHEKNLFQQSVSQQPHPWAPGCTGRKFQKRLPVALRQYREFPHRPTDRAEDAAPPGRARLALGDAPPGLPARRWLAHPPWPCGKPPRPGSTGRKLRSRFPVALRQYREFLRRPPARAEDAAPLPPCDRPFRPLCPFVRPLCTTGRGTRVADDDAAALPGQDLRDDPP